MPLGRPRPGLTTRNVFETIVKPHVLSSKGSFADILSSSAGGTVELGSITVDATAGSVGVPPPRVAGRWTLFHCPELILSVDSSRGIYSIAEHHSQDSGSAR
jgi:hypothetical protein